MSWVMLHNAALPSLMFVVIFEVEHQNKLIK